MKALAVRQPWAHLIATSQKTIEIRSWKTKHRGDILIVSSSIDSHINYDCSQLQTQTALCIASLVDCRLATADDVERALCDIYENDYAWILENIRPVIPFKIKPRLRLFEVPDHLCIYCK